MQSSEVFLFLTGWLVPLQLINVIFVLCISSSYWDNIEYSVYVRHQSPTCLKYV